MQNGVNILTPPFDGPAEHVRNVVFELQKLGNVVDVLIQFKGSYFLSHDLSHFEQIDPHGIDKKFLLFFEKAIRRIQSTLHLPYFALFESLRFYRICHHYLPNTEIFLERISWMGYGGTFAKKSLKKPLIIEFNGDPIHDLDAKNESPKGIQLKISKSLYRFVLRNAEKIIASGEGWRNNLVKNWQVPTDQVVIIENGTTLVDLLSQKDLKSFSVIQKQEETIQIIYLGGFYPWHGTDILMEAFKNCLVENPKIHLTFIGAGNGLEDAKKSVKKLNLEDKIEFTGQLTPKEFAPLLANSDIAVSPYCGWVEYSGLKIFDYKAAGLAIIASGEGDQPKTLIQGKTGMIIPPCDLNALTHSLKLLIDDQHLRVEFGKNARIDAEENHSWKKTGENVENLLQDVLIGVHN